MSSSFFVNRNFFSIFVSVCILASLALAAHDATTSSGALVFYLIEDRISVFNISINNSDFGQSANISSVTITFPESFVIVAGSQNTSSHANKGFTSSSTFLNWTNNTFYLINGSGGDDTRYFWFSANTTNPGTYSLIITITNGSATFNPRNLSVVVNDTTAPSAYSLFPGNNGVSRSSTFTFSGIFSDATNITRVTLYLWNSSGSLINSTIVNTSVAGTSSIANFTLTFPKEDRYYYNFLTNDTANNSAFNATNFTMVYDITPPTVSLAKSSFTPTTLAFTATIADTLAGINTSCRVVNRGSATVSGTSGSQTINESGLTCGTNYTLEVACNDAAGNEARSNISASTDICTNSSSTSNNAGTTNWASTFIAETSALETGYTKELAAKDRVRVTVKGQDHYVGILEIDSTTAKIEVSSTPQRATLIIGESKKFEVTNDTTYDLAVTLLSINGSKASITIHSISEPIPLSEQIRSGNASGQGGTSNTSAANQSVAKSRSAETIKKFAPYLWITMAVLLIALCALLYYVYQNKNKYLV